MPRFISHFAAGLAGAFGFQSVVCFAIGDDMGAWFATGLCAVSVAFMAATMPRAAR